MGHTGENHADILINNAGVALMGPSNAATEAEFNETFAVNVKVPPLIVVALAPAMAERGWGSIVNISTMVVELRTARHGDVLRQPCGARAVDEGLGRRIRPLGGVRVNVIFAGLTCTWMMEAVPEEMVEPSRSSPRQQVAVR